ncbi:MAG: DUF2953 domain-containing protein [Clostridium luticellarii]|jgi:hypothetical protein|uniref:DUF2953 domain-containing protein n=1 Tax=Clostridium luticellarii TaxID=1691940 RepID=UPI0023560FA2|nr:DUF2953 domain-containing protein [Clostridium luticellarii]MCI2038647.1 DUF2953 domain-containing protein [Clostridium luticellarii]
MNILYILLVLLLFTVLFLPTPLRINIKYKDGKLTVKLYSLNITNRIKLNKSSLKNPSGKNPLFAFIKELKSLNFNEINTKFPLKMNIKFHYGLNDAAYTAITYGALSSLKVLIFNMLKKVFSIKKYNLIIEPDFNNPIFELEVTSIIYINLVKIIYMYRKLSNYKKLNKPMRSNSA